MCRVPATYNNTQNIQAKIFIVIHGGWSKSPCRFHFFNRIHKNLNSQTFMNVHININNSQSVILSSLKISWPILHQRLSPLSTLQSAKRNPFELHQPLVFVFFVQLSFSLRFATHLCSLRITVCQNSRVQKEQRVDRSQGERQHDQRKRNADWKSAATLREGASARKLGLCENNTNHERDAIVQRALSHHRHGGIIFFFSPYPSKYVDYIWWSSRRLRFNSRQLSRNIQTYLILFDRTLDTKLRINEKTTMIFQYIRGHLVELWFYVETHICVARNWTTFQTLSRYFISVNCYIALL